MPLSKPRAFLYRLSVVAGLALCNAPGIASDAAPAAAVIDPSDRGQGMAVVIGGGLSNEHHAVWEHMVGLSGGPGARWVVLATASENPADSARQAADQLRRRGAVVDELPVSPRLKGTDVAAAVADPALVAKVRAARGVFFTGGSQSRIVDHLFPGGRATPLLQAIWDIYRAGGVVAGTSAGAAVMSTTMFRDAPSPLAVMQGLWAEGREVDRGLGFVGPDLFVDQHFLRRGRIGRMLPLMRARGYPLGLGVEEDSAAFVRGNAVEVMGQVVLADLRAATSDAQLGVFNVRGARLSLMETGDTLDLGTVQITPSPPKLRGQKIDPAAADYAPYYTSAPRYTDFLSEHTLATAMTLLIDGEFAELTGLAFSVDGPDTADKAAGQGSAGSADSTAADLAASLGFEFRLYKGPGSDAWYSEDSGAEDYTVRNLWLDVSPVRVNRPVLAPWRRPGSAAAQ